MAVSTALLYTFIVVMVDDSPVTMAVSTALLYTFIVVMVAIIVVSIIGNLLVILAVFLCPSLRKRDNIPLASLSVSDLLFTALHPPMWIVALLNPEFRLPWGLCVLQSYTTPVLWGVCLCHMGCIAVYRLFRILYRYRFPAMISTKAICIKVTLAWLVPFLSFILIHLNPARDVKYDDKIKHCAVVQTSSLLAKAIAGLPVICPYFVALACYIAIWLSLRKSKKTMLRHNLLEAPKVTNKSSTTQGGSTSHMSDSSGRGNPGMVVTQTSSTVKDDIANLPGVPEHKVAAPKIRIKTSSVPQEGSTSHRVSIVLEEEGSLRRGSMVVTTSSRDDIENLPGVPEHSAIIKTKCSWTKTHQDSGEPSELDEADEPQASAAPSAEDNITNISLPASTIGGDKIPSSSLEVGKRAFKKAFSPPNRQPVTATSSSSVTEEDIENLPGMPEHSTMIYTRCSWSELNSGDSSELDKADQPQARPASRSKDNTTRISLSARGYKIPSLPPEGGKRAVRESLSPSRRQLVLEPESSGKKIGRRAYVHEERDSYMTTTDCDLPNTTVHDLSTTVHDLSTTVSVSRSSFNRADIAGKRKKPRRLHLSPAEKEMLKMMVAVFINYALCNLPMTVMALAENGDRVPEEAFLVGMLLWAGNGAMNPIIYGFMNTRFKQGYRDIWNRFTRLFR
ncbi:hypothetical protein Bbelb_022790 [Branchiostoma belcheri]|nr:hypothetical protein Bbelb_022790 [Branchiostoma belcheri]